MAFPNVPGCTLQGALKPKIQGVASQRRRATSLCHNVLSIENHNALDAIKHRFKQRNNYYYYNFKCRQFCCSFNCTCKGIYSSATAVEVSLYQT